MKTTEITLEFDQIKNMLCANAMSEQAQERLARLQPFLSQRECRLKTEETTEARQMLDSLGNPPLSAMKEMENVTALCDMGSMLTASQLSAAATFAASSRRVKVYLKKAESLQTGLAYYGQSICELSELREEIENAIAEDRVLSSASPQLQTIRRNIEKEGAQIQKKLSELLSGKKNYFSESMVTMRNGRYVVPVKREFKNQFPGTVIDMSGSGGTYFMEPHSVSQLQEHISQLRMEEDNEVRTILYTLTALVGESMAEIRLNMEAMVTLDVIFAKAKLSAAMKAIPAHMETDRRIQIHQGRHPLLAEKDCVPLDFSTEEGVRGVVITGPNTGGKTVALKTIGLFSMMAQCGLHVPAQEARITMNNVILCDIGDGQSITENLSTFSAHITNIIEILSAATQESLVLLDELGSGTDPAEGMGIAISILEELRRRGCLFVATTHYPEVKEYAEKSQGLVNARMAFDRQSLSPLYRLEIGEAGESCALYIAKRLGLPTHMLRRAQHEAYRSQAVAGELPESGFETEDGTETMAVPTVMPRISKEVAAGATVFQQKASVFHRGDCVAVSPEKSLGVVFAEADEKGMVGVQIKGEKSYINQKRLTVKVAADQLYPEDYDLSIVFDSVENRKLRHQMDRKYIKGLAIELEPGTENSRK